MAAQLEQLNPSLLATAADWFGGSPEREREKWSVANEFDVGMSIEVDDDVFVFRDVISRYWPERWEYVRTADPDALLRCVLYRAAFWYRKRKGLRFLALADQGIDESSGWEFLTKPRKSPAVLERTGPPGLSARFSVARDARMFTRYVALPLPDLVTSLVSGDGAPLFGPGQPGHMLSELPGRLAALPPERMDKAVQYAAIAEPLVREDQWAFMNRRGEETTVSATADGFLLDFEMPRDNADRKRFYVRTEDPDILTRCLLLLCSGADRFLAAADSRSGGLPYSDRYGCRIENPEQTSPVNILGASEAGPFSAFFPTATGARHLTYYAGAPIHELLASIESGDGSPLFTPERLSASGPPRS